MIDYSIAMLDPKNQVEYIIKHLSSNMVQRCADRWVGCYHHPSNADRAQAYQKKVLDKSKILTVNILNHMKEKLSSLSIEVASTLPQIQKEEFYQTWQRSIQMNPPEDLEYALLDFFTMDRTRDYALFN
ncbi:MAG: hypothetical protein ACOH5I_19580 [Oligoflexus sp.]